ncbi:MAG: hypothetical protein ACOYLE_08385 [Bacteroidales bacterium]
MITITRPAAAIDFCGNGLVYKLKSDKAYAANGNKAELAINVNAPIITGNTISFLFGNKSVVFTTSPTPDDNGSIILSGSNAAEFTASLNKNFLLQKYFIITNIGNQIILTAKQSGSFYSLTFFANTANVSFYHNIPGSDKIIRSGYKLLCETYIEKDRDTNAFELISTSLHNVDENGNSIIYPGKLLSKYFNDIDLPDFNQTAIKLVKKTVKKYFLQLADYYDSSVKQIIKTNTLYAIDGTVDADLFTNAFNFIDYLSTTKSYLLAADIDKFETWNDAQQFLYYVSYLVSCNFSQKVKIYYTDGSDTTITKQTVNAALRGDCFVIPCGFTQLNLQSVTPLKEVYKYEVYLESSGILIGKQIRFYLVPKPLFAREFWFKNSMGAMEAVFCEKQIHKFDIKRSELLTDNRYLTDIDEINDSYECTTGNKTAKEIEHLAEFVSSKKTYLLQKGNIYEVALEQATYTLADDNEDLYNFKFKYRIVKNNSVQTTSQIIITSGGVVPGVVVQNKKIVVGFNTI